MAYRTRIKYTAEQKNEIWDRWQRGESQSSIGRLFDRESSSKFWHKFWGQSKNYHSPLLAAYSLS